MNFSSTFLCICYLLILLAKNKDNKIDDRNTIIVSKKNDISAKGEVSTDNKSERLNDFCVSTKACCSSSQCTLVCGEKMVQDVYWERKAILDKNIAQNVLVMQTML